MTVAGIVLAAGASRRLGQPKQLLMLDGETLLERAIRQAAESGADPVFVILGAHSEQIRATVSLTHAIPVLNSAWEQGIASSIQAALGALDASAPQASGALILTCDQPRLTAAHLRALLQAFAAHPAPAIVASAYAGILGIPAVFPRQVFADLRALRGDKGARALLMHPPCPLLALPFLGGDIDIDEPADLAQLES
jgi:CTP:molybdopterin cytidylyltransferase MocA